MNFMREKTSRLYAMEHLRAIQQAGGAVRPLSIPRGELSPLHMTRAA